MVYPSIVAIILFLVNYWSVNVFGKINSFITALKFVVPALTIIVLFTNFHISNFTSHGFAPGGFTGIESAVSTAGIVFAFLGFRQAVDFAGEAKDPQRTVPIAIILAISIGAILYILLQVVFVGAVPADALAKGWVNLNYNAPFADLAIALGMGWLGTILFADAVISPSGTANIYLSSTARVLFAWARTGTFFKVMTRVSPKAGVPRPALWLSFLLSLFWTLPFPTWGTLVGVVSSATVMTYIIGPVSAAAFRKTAPDLIRPFRLGGMSVIAPLAFVIASLIIYWTRWSIDSWLIGSQLIVFVIYLLLNKLMPTDKISLGTQLKSTWWLIIYFIVMFGLSYFGSKAFGGTGALSNPWDQIVVIIISFAAYYWGIASALQNRTFNLKKRKKTLIFP